LTSRAGGGSCPNSGASVAKPTDGGQLSEDSASRARDADLQEANVLEMTRRVNRLLVKTRRDNRQRIVSGGKTVWKTVTLEEVDDQGQTGGRWSEA